MLTSIDLRCHHRAHGTEGVEPGTASRSAAVHARGLAEHPAVPNTRAAYRCDLEAFGNWCARQGAIPLTADTATLVAFQAAREAAGDSDSTIRRRWSALSSFYDFAVERELRCDQPSDSASIGPRCMSGDPSPTVQLSDEAVASYRAAAAALDPRLDALVALLVCDGLKVAEALALDVDDVSGRRAGDDDHRSAARRVEADRPRPRQRSCRPAMHRQAPHRPRVRQRTIVEVRRPASADPIRRRPSHPPTQNRRRHRTGHRQRVATIPHQRQPSRRQPPSTTSDKGRDSQHGAVCSDTTTCMASVP